jgi:DNA mismatch repair protein MutL
MVKSNRNSKNLQNTRVKLLGENTASKIAAGEVIESPLSVVKELIENSLDANCSVVNVSIENGGINTISIIDDGEGIHPNDLELIFQRFATSKINSINDLFQLTTLGFRGEALPSISAVSKINLTSKRIESSGFEIELFNGEKTKHKVAAISKGTSIKVTNLFENVPARLKFLGTSSQESTKIKTLISDYSIVYPDVKFVLISDGSTKISTPGTGDILEAYSSIHGNEITESMLKLELDKMISGITSNTSIARGNRSNIKFSVNQRIIKNSSLLYAVETAYSGLIEPRRFPFTFINIKIDPELIDVNVHPAKTEIKFRDEREIFRTILDVIRTTLTHQSSIPEINYKKNNSYSQSFNKFNSNFQDSNIETSKSFIDKNDDFEDNKELNDKFNLTEEKISLKESKVIGTLDNTFIICTHKSGILIIDQHGAHERINFESILEDMNNNNIGQRLLEPIIIDINVTKFNQLISQRLLFKKFGLDFEELDDSSIIIRSIPSVIAESRDIQGKLVEIIEDIDVKKITDWQYWISAELACKSSVKARTKLTIKECEELIKKLSNCKEIHDPHGRPVIMRLPINTIKNQFHRS